MLHRTIFWTIFRTIISHTKSWILFATLLFVAAAPLAGCDDDNPPPEETEPMLVALQVTPATATLAIGTTQQYTATAFLSDGATRNVTNQSTWTSSNPNLITIDAYGLAEALESGIVEISATYKGMTSRAALTVSEARVYALELSPTEVTLPVGISKKFTATAVFSDNSRQDVTSEAHWSSTNRTVARVDSVGFVTALAVGEARIRAEFDGASSSTMLTVEDAIPIKLLLTAERDSTNLGIPIQLSVDAILTNGRREDFTREVDWQLSDDTLASIDDTGQLTPLAVGAVEVVAAFGHATSDELTITIGDAIVTDLRILPHNISLPKGTTEQLTAWADFSDGSGPVDVSELADWQTSDVARATISDTGELTGLNTGPVTVTATLEGQTAQVSAWVTGALLTELEIFPTSPPELPIGATFRFEAVGRFSDGSHLDMTDQVVWTSGDDAIATISNAQGSQGVVTAVSGGNTELTASLDEITSRSVPLRVQTGVSLSFITLESPSLTLSIGQTRQLTATGHYTNGSSFDLTRTATWAAVEAESDTAISAFSVNATGLLEAHSSTAGLPLGKGRVKVSQGAVVAYASVVVKDTAIIAIDVDCQASPSSARLGCMPAGSGFTVACKAEATFSDSTRDTITSSATWASSDSYVAFFQGLSADNEALFLVSDVGSAALYASQGGVSSPQTNNTDSEVSAINATIAALAITPPTHQMPDGASHQFDARASFASVVEGCESFDLEVTELATWSSSNFTYATVSNAPSTRGLVQSVSPGQVQIQASFHGFVATSALEVLNACIASVQIDQADPTYPDDVVVRLSVKAIDSDGTPTQLEPGTGLSFSAPSGAVIENTERGWFLDTGALPNGDTAITFAATQQAGACQDIIVDTTTISVDGDATLTSLVLDPSAPMQIPTGGEIDYAALASFAGYGAPFNVTKSVWSADGWDLIPAIGVAYNMSDQSAPTHLRLFAGQTMGTTTVTAVYENLTATGELSVSGAVISEVRITDIFVGHESVSFDQTFPSNLELRFSAEVEYSDGNILYNPPGLRFESDSPTKIDFLGGTAFARTYKASGNTAPLVVARFEEVKSAEVPIKIAQVPLTSLYFSPTGPLNLPMNALREVLLRGVWASPVDHAFDLSTQVACTSGNSTLVSVSTSQAGTFVNSHGVSTGSTPVPITCTKAMVATSIGVAVGDACLSTVSLEPASTTLPDGTSRGFVARGTYSDGTKENVTESGLWASSNPSVLVDKGFVSEKKERRFESAQPGTATVEFFLTHPSVCDGGMVSDTTLEGFATVRVSPAEIDTVEILPGPVAGAMARRVPLGESIQLFANVILTDGSSDDVTSDTGTVWSSQSPSIASVSQRGALIANAAGTTIVQVRTHNGKSAMLFVKVLDCGKPMVHATTDTTGNLPIGSARSYSADATYPETACDADLSERQFEVTAKARWESSDDDVATISSSGDLAGLATGQSEGATKIWALYMGSKSNEIQLDVVNVKLESLQISPASPINTYVGEGSAVSLTVIATYSDGSELHVLDPPPITWLIVDPSIITIDSDGALTGLEVGSTTFRALSGGILSDARTATISSACITGIEIVDPPSDLSLPGGVPLALETACATSDGSNLPCNPTFQMLSGSEIMDDYSQTFPTSGKLRLYPGATVGNSATLRARIDNGCGGNAVFDDLMVTVNGAQLDALTLSPTQATIPRGEKRSYTTLGRYIGSGLDQVSYDLSPVAELSSTNPLVATPDQGGSGIVTAGTIDGTTLITSSYLGLVSNGSMLKVSGAVLSGLTLSAEANCTGSLSGVDAAIPSGDYVLQLSATGTYSDGTHRPLELGLTWSLDEPTLSGAHVGSQWGGFISGDEGGVQTIRVSAGDISTTFDVAVVNSPMASIAIEGASEMPRGEVSMYEAVAQLVGTSAYCSTNAYQARTNVDWASSDPAIGSIVMSGAKAGTFEAHELGGVSLTATHGDATGGPYIVHVSNAIPESLRCVPSSLDINLGDKAMLRAVVMNTDGTEFIAPMSQAAWNLSIESGQDYVDFGDTETPGLLTGRAPGDALIEPNWGELPITESCTIRVH